MEVCKDGRIEGSLSGRKKVCKEGRKVAREEVCKDGRTEGSLSGRKEGSLHRWKDSSLKGRLS